MNAEAIDQYLLYAGEAVEGLQALPDNSVDAIICDPPYGTASPTKFRKGANNTATTHDLPWDQYLQLDWLPEAYRVLKPGAALLFFTDNKAITTAWDATKASGLKPLQTAYWAKNNPPPNPRQNFMSAVESMIFARKPGKIHCWNGGATAQNLFRHPLVGGHERTGHPTQKPIKLMRALVELVSQPGHLVVDPYAGSASTGVAALQIGRRFYGCEREAEYLAMAAARLGATLQAALG